MILLTAGIKCDKIIFMKRQKTSKKLFDDSSIRSYWNAEEGDWYYCVTDVVTYFKDNSDTDDYIKKLRRRDTMLSKMWNDIIVLLPVQTPGGVQKAKFTNTSGMIRILFSITSERANAFKVWLARAGADAVNAKNSAITMNSVFKDFSLQKVKQAAKARPKFDIDIEGDSDKEEKPKSKSKASKTSKETKTAAKGKTSLKDKAAAKGKASAKDKTAAKGKTVAKGKSAAKAKETKPKTKTGRGRTAKKK